MTIAVCLALLGCAEAEPRAKGSDVTPSASTTFDQAVAHLGDERTLCKGAETLVQLDDARALLPLAYAYRKRAEGHKQCVIDAITKLARAERVTAAYQQATAPAERAALLIVGYLAPHDALLPLAEGALVDDDQDVRWQARRMLSNWKNTPSWRATVCRMLASPDKQARQKAIELLAPIRGAEIDEALATQARHETEPTLKQKLDAVIAKRATSTR